MMLVSWCIWMMMSTVCIVVLIVLGTVISGVMTYLMMTNNNLFLMEAGMDIETVKNIILGTLAVSFGLVPFWLLVVTTWQRRIKS